MSLSRVAQLAGVSVATVSRVLNGKTNVAADTADAVRRCMRELNVVPKARRSKRQDAGAPPQVALIVFRESGNSSTSAFQELLAGVSDAANAHPLRLSVHFFSPDEPLPAAFLDRLPRGLLLHGERPCERVARQLAGLPAVWLMSSSESPTWGDQVMPDDTLVGELAARHLLDRGHRELAFLGNSSGCRTAEVRALAFAAVGRERGARVRLLMDYGGLVDRQVPPAIESLRAMAGLMAVDALGDPSPGDASPRPTGLFVAEDRLLPVLGAQLIRRGLTAGPRREVEIVSCNDAGAYHTGPYPSSATVDVRAGSIGRRAVEQLMWRMRSFGPSVRTRLLVEPRLVLAPTSEAMPAARKSAEPPSIDSKSVDATSIDTKRVNARPVESASADGWKGPPAAPRIRRLVSDVA